MLPLAIAATLAACGGGGSGSMNPSSPGALPAVTSSNAPESSLSTLTSSAYGAAVMNDRPVAFYALNDSGTTAQDSSGNALSGAIGSSVKTGQSGLIAGWNAMAFPVTQSAAGAISIAPSSLLQPSSSVSLEAVFKESTTPANYTVLAAYGQRSGTASYELFFKNNQVIAQFTFKSGFATVASGTLQTGKTYDAVASYDGTTARLYLNGSQVASSPATGTLGYVSGYGLSIGDDASHSNPAFSGEIAGVSVYASALPASRVQAHYQAMSAASTPAPSPTIRPTAAPSPTTAPTSAPTAAPVSGSVVWKAGDATLGRFITANTYQCGNPVGMGSTITFTLNKSGTSCGRNQANPVDGSGSTLRLADGATYTWTFTYIDGKPDGTGPGMGMDTGSDPESLIWQIHGYNESDSPCTGLTFVNGSYYSGSLGAGQQWSFSTCKGNVWYGKYTPGERDTFKIVAHISEGSTGWTQLYRNGQLVVSDNGANYHNSSGNPWWNFGPYKWRWELSSSGSSMSQVNATFENLTLTKQ